MLVSQTTVLKIKAAPPKQLPKAVLETPSTCTGNLLEGTMFGMLTNLHEQIGTSYE